MLRDAREVSAGETLQADLCIVGGGAAGITLALELADSGRRVLLLESGGLDYDGHTQAIYEGEVVGLPIHPLNISRLRFLGGATNHWGGLSRPLDALDYQPRDWVAHSGWPFDHAHMQPYYERAQRHCELGPLAYEVDDWEVPERPRLPLGEGIASYCFQNSPPTRFGEAYRGVLEAAENVHVYLHANAVELVPDRDLRRVESVQVATLGGERFSVQARRVVLASGGIENARLLLASNTRQAQGLGNGNDLVGRYFMEHPTVRSGLLVVTDRAQSVRLYLRHRVNDLPVQAFLRPSDRTLQAERMLNCGFIMKDLQWSDESDGAEALRALLDGARSRELPEGLGSHILRVIGDVDGLVRSGYGKLRGHQLLELHYWAEQEPNPDSRVTLAERTDPFGKPRARLDWRLSDADRRNVDRAHEILAGELGAAGLGRVRLDYEKQGDTWEPGSSHHHMGTTRMHTDPRQGVVDADCRMHALHNVYVAGSSVFPTVGHTPPTLTIVALAVRLADHLKRETA